MIWQIFWRPGITGWRSDTRRHLLNAMVLASMVAAAAVVSDRTAFAQSGRDVVAAADRLTLDAPTMDLLSDLDVLRGGDIEPSALAGKFVVVNFFASWCAPCRAEFRELNALIDEVGAANIKVVTINWLEDAPHLPQASLQIYRVLDRLNPHITAVAGTGEVSRLFGGDAGIGAIPALFAFGPNGAEIFRFLYRPDSTRSHTTADDLRRAMSR